MSYFCLQDLLKLREYDTKDLQKKIVELEGDVERGVGKYDEKCDKHHLAMEQTYKLKLQTISKCSRELVDKGDTIINENGSFRTQLAEKDKYVESLKSSGMSNNQVLLFKEEKRKTSRKESRRGKEKGHEQSRATRERTPTAAAAAVSKKGKRKR